MFFELIILIVPENYKIKCGIYLNNQTIKIIVYILSNVKFLCLFRGVKGFILLFGNKKHDRTNSTFVAFQAGTLDELLTVFFEPLS